MNKIFNKIPLLFIPFCFTAQVNAEQVDATLTINMDVPSVCSFNMISKNNITLSYSYGNENSENLYYRTTCTKGTTYIVEVDNGLYGQSANDRKMKHDSKEFYLPYAIHGGNSNSYPIIGTRAEGNHLALIGSGEMDTNYLHFRVNALLNRVAQGTYKDTVRLIVSY